MTDKFKDVEHLLRLAGLFAAGVVLFVGARAALVPDGFGALGHFRAASLQENRDQEPVFAGRAACAECHTDVVETLHGGGHSGVGCEACHGAQARHAADPGAPAPAKPEPARLCPVCHQRNAAKPRSFPQVDLAEHYGGEVCTTCHPSHQPL